MLDFLWLIPLLPFLGFLVNALITWRGADPHANERMAGWIAASAVVLAFLLSLTAFIELAMSAPAHADSSNPAFAIAATDPYGTDQVASARADEPHAAPRHTVILWEWIGAGTIRIPFGLMIDPLSGVMMLLVTGVGALIHIYSIGYMHGDEKAVRFFAYLNLFIVMMLLLVMGNNLLLLFLGWEGVGLCSFLLIGHWFERKSATSAAVKAFVVNRIGDAAFVLAMLAIFFYAGTLTFYNVEVNGQVIYHGFLEDSATVRQFFSGILQIPGQPIAISTAITLLLLIGVTGKSAQIPLFVWLPDAMEGPTPVSALIHAATMVTAGVYLIVRTNALFDLSSAARSTVAFIGALTALIAASAAIAQWDIKRVLAYSTVSQLGFMVAAAGLGAYVAAIFHLLTHGVFKALLFLGSGSVIHGANDNQDMRKMGGLREPMKLTFWVYMIGALSLAGVFPFAGFWSKDEILASAMPSDHGGNSIIFAMLMLSSLMTAFYMGRQMALVFYGEQRDKTYHAHESGQMMLIPLFVLAAGTCIVGIINIPGIYWLSHWLDPVLANPKSHDFGTAQLTLAIVATLFALGSGYVGWNYYLSNAFKVKPGEKDPLYRYTGDIWDIMEQAWYFDIIYTRYTIVFWYHEFADFLARVFDPQGIDGMVNGVGFFFQRTAGMLRLVQSGFVRSYALMFLAGVVVIVGYLVVVQY